MTKKQKYFLAIAITVLLLILFLLYYFRNRKTGEKCPDGRDIPQSGNCSDNPVLTDANGNTIVSPSIADANGCIQPSSYVVNSFPLTVGMKGDLVKQVQIRLNTDFNSGIKEDGYFGCKTLAEVIKAFSVQSIDAELFKNAIQGNILLSATNPNEVI